MDEMIERELTDAERLARRICARVFRRVDPKRAPWRGEDGGGRDLVRPGAGYVGAREGIGVALGRGAARRLFDLASLPQGDDGHRLVAMRYFVENAEIWLEHFALDAHTGGADARALAARVAALRASVAAPDGAWIDRLLSTVGPLAGELDAPELLEAIVTLALYPDARASGRERLRERAPGLFATAPALLDRAYLASHELHRYPATTVSAGSLRYVLVADKGEMGVRAVREALALGKIPVVLHSVQDDANALQVRLARTHGGFAIGLTGSFRESYASYVQIATRTHEIFRERFGGAWQDELARAALYPGYGPLAENAAAIRHFRRTGIAFVGPMEDVVEQAGDKRRFRAIAEAIEPAAVTPGIVLAESDPQRIRSLVLEGHAAGKFAFPGRLKAANGGGGRGQAIVPSADALDGAIAKVLGEIESMRWEPGVMFEQNIPRTIHLEVQIMRDRYGNARHFGMRDCTEQRASQKIQEEAPPALLRAAPELRQRIERTAVAIAERVGYVGAGTIELMYAEGKVYFLEMNTRIQVEHPVTEESHGIRRASGEIERLNLVAWQLRIADGAPIDFAQEDVVETHVARELRINAESWIPDHKDSRDGKRGLFVPNAGVFDRIEVPTPDAVIAALGDDTARRIDDLRVRFDVGFEAGDVLVNKDPTFGKLVVAVRAKDRSQDYELLRVACLAVLDAIRIEGRQVRPDGKIIPGSRLLTNIPAHSWILQHEMHRRHAAGDSRDRHVNWVVDALRTT